MPFQTEIHLYVQIIFQKTGINVYTLKHRIIQELHMQRSYINMSKYLHQPNELVNLVHICNAKSLDSAARSWSKVHADGWIDPQNGEDCRWNCPYPIPAY